MTELLESLHAPLLEEVSGLENTPDGLRGQLDLRYGLLAFQIDHDHDQEALRVSVRLPPPLGAGQEFLIWCLSLNAQSWKAKIGVDESGFILVHADLAVAHGEGEPEVELLREEIIESIDDIAELIDENLCGYLLERQLGTPTQIERWSGEHE